jgi:hypothetical protein
MTSNVHAREEAKAQASEAKAAANEEAKARACEAKAEELEVVGDTVPLPKLDSVRVPEPALRCGEWLTRVALVIRCLSPTSGVWWADILETAQEAYRVWMQADPLEKSKARGPVKPWPKYEQLSYKVSSLMLEAVSPNIVKDALHDKDLEPAALIFRILKAYQPGGLEERIKVIAELSTTKAMTTAGEAVEELRRWECMRSRAVELKITIPDPYVQWLAVGLEGSRTSGELGRIPQVPHDRCTRGGQGRHRSV